MAIVLCRARIDGYDRKEVLNMSEVVEVNYVKEMKEAYDKFIDYTVDHICIFNTNNSDVKKNARILYDNYDKAYREFRQSYIEKYGEDVVVRCAAIMHDEYATRRLSEYK